MSAAIEARKKKEIREQQALAWFINGNHNISEITEMPEWSSFDNYITSAGTEYMVEVKIRTDYTFSQITKYGGAFLELDKLAGILEFQEKNNIIRPILYANFFKDKVVVFQINPDPTSYSWITKKLQKNDFDKRLTWKAITCLPVEQIVEIKNYK